MARKDATLELDRPDGDPEAENTPRPCLILPLGRGKTGKSTFVRWAAERAIQRGGTPVIADADRTNATLSAFFENVARPDTPEDDDMRSWLNAFVDRQIEERFSAFLDLGGGDLILKTWARDLDLAAFLDGYGIDPVALHFISSDRDDLTYLRDIELVTKFQPQRMAIVLNEGMVPPGRTARTAFAPILEHEVFKAAVARGARVIRMPRLAPMYEIEHRRLSFTNAEAGAVKPGQDKIGPVNRQLISIWRKEMEASFAPILPWLP